MVRDNGDIFKCYQTKKSTCKLQCATSRRRLSGPALSLLLTRFTVPLPWTSYHKTANLQYEIIIIIDFLVSSVRYFIISWLYSPTPQKKFAALGDCLVRQVGWAGTHCNICVFAKDLQPHDTYQTLTDATSRARTHARTEWLTDWLRNQRNIAGSFWRIWLLIKTIKEFAFIIPTV